VPECPVEAILEASAVPDAWKPYIELNAKESAKNAKINKKVDPLPTAEAKKAKIDASKDPDIERKKAEEAEAKARAEKAKAWEAKRAKYRPYLRDMRAKRETVLSQTEARTERDRRYGRAYRLLPRENGLTVEMELARTVPDHWLKTRLGVADPMPPYRTQATLASPTRLIVEGWLEDRSLDPLIGVVGAFPPRFRREIDLPCPVRNVQSRYRASDRVLELTLEE
ncbi:MAG: hypothetical protein HY608_09010, partial [Planctomycetes bacterium]|nr:hypothetical protein [Planctomycetota bacterium]